MKKKVALNAALLWVGLCGVGAAASAAAELQVSGLQPNQRPDWAPSIDQAKHGREWYNHALTGVGKPYPASLRFLEDQGNWYTPFDRPGMPAPYDIRGWHAQ